MTVDELKNVIPEAITGLASAIDTIIRESTIGRTYQKIGRALKNIFFRRLTWREGDQP